jgi:hypothetical protein
MGKCGHAYLAAAPRELKTGVSWPSPDLIFGCDHLTSFLSRGHRRNGRLAGAQGSSGGTPASVSRGKRSEEGP